MILNKYNFLRWSDAVPSTDQPDIPWAYWRDRDRQFMPIAYPTEAMAFYINTLGDVGLNYSSFSDLRLAVVNASTGVVANSNAGTLVQHFLDAPTNTIYNIYCTFTIPTLADGVYKLRIYRNTGGAVLCESNYIQVRNDKTNLDVQSGYFKFQHDRYFYGIKYADLPSFYQQFRLPASLIERQLESEKEVYKEVTTGKQRTFQNYVSRVLKIELYYLDQEAHEAAGLLFEHSFIQINGKRYRLKSTYKELTNVLNKTTKGEVELYDEEFSSVNRC